MHKMMWSNATVVVRYVSFCVSVCLFQCTKMVEPSDVSVGMDLRGSKEACVR